MADWVNISDTALDPDAPLTSELAYAWRDNPIAISGGVSGAPRVQGRALGNVHLFSGQITTTPTVFTGLDQALDLMIDGTARHDGTNGGTLRIEFSNNGGSTWGSSQLILGATNVNDWVTATITIDVVTGAGYYIGSGQTSGTVGPVFGALSLSVPSGVNAVRLLRGAGANTVYAAMFVIGGYQ